MADGLSVGMQLILPKLGTLDASEAATALRKASREIADEIETRIRARTPKRTGALREDVASKSYTGGVTGTRDVNLVSWYSEVDAQLSEWGRVYAAYQEGPPLGLSTYTNGPHQMFQKVETEDMPEIEAWVQSVLDRWSESAASEAQAGAETFTMGEV